MRNIAKFIYFNQQIQFVIVYFIIRLNVLISYNYVNHSNFKMPIINLKTKILIKIDRRLK